MADYGYIKCLEPRHIFNKYTGETILAECGKCEACLLKKSLASTMRCNLESSFHKFDVFVTLTYANKYLPKVRLINKWSNSCDDKCCYDVVRESDGNILGEVVFPSEIYKHQLIKKTNMYHNTLPVLDSRDVQLFLKRLRKKLNEKIRVFYCGEYGPVHFRPHYHLKLWFDQEETLSVIHEAIRQAWPFGRVDSSLSSGKSSSYVAAYINGNCYLPKVFKLSSAKPFSNHSWYLGENVFQTDVQKLKETPYCDIAKRRFFGNGLNTDVVLWRSLKTRLFPKSQGYSRLNGQELSLSYRSYAIIRDWTKETCPIFQARFISDYVKYYDFYHEDSLICDLLQYYRSCINYYDRDVVTGFVRQVFPSLVDYAKFERMVYMNILKSKHFLKVICNGQDDYYSVERSINWIKGFYNYIDSDSLKNQLKIESDLSKNEKFDSSLFFSNTLVVDKLKGNCDYKSYRTSIQALFKDFMKHRELNDLNQYFIY